jgi:hypothetical protein
LTSRDRVEMLIERTRSAVVRSRRPRPLVSGRGARARRAAQREMLEC